MSMSTMWVEILSNIRIFHNVYVGVKFEAASVAIIQLL